MLLPCPGYWVDLIPTFLPRLLQELGLLMELRKGKLLTCPARCPFFLVLASHAWEVSAHLGPRSAVLVGGRGGGRGVHWVAGWEWP